MSAVVDACFFINWSQFKQRDDIFKLFHTLIIPEIVLDEIRNSIARSYLYLLAYQRRVSIAPRVGIIDREALKLFTLINSSSILPRIDEPESYGLALALMLKLPFLTDNAAPRLATRYIEYLREAKVYDSLIVLKMLYKGKKLITKVKKYSDDTGVIFSEERLQEEGIKWVTNF